MTEIPVSESYAVWACARYFDWFQNRVFPNVHLCGGEMDLAVVTRAKYLWEVEVKCTLADWRADEHKRKWQSPSRKYVTRFFYAVPPTLKDSIPLFVPESAGILVFDGLHARLVRDAKRCAGPKLEDRQIHLLLESTYNRFWRERLYRHTRQISDARWKMEKGATA